MRLSRFQSLFRLEEVSGYAPLLLLGALVLLVGVHPQLPSDDALRHVVSYAWGYSHTAMYPQSSLTQFNQYPLFDHLVGSLSRAAGVFATLKLLQVAALALAATTFQRAFTRFLPTEEHRSLDATLLTLLVLCAGVLDRTMLARPEVFAMGWAVAWLGMPPKSRVWLAGLLAIGFAVSASYWVAWLSWPLVWLAPVSVRRRVAVLATLGCFHIGFWHLYTGGAYWQVFQLLPAWNAQRLTPVLETAAVWTLLVRPAVVACLGLVAAGALRGARSWRDGALALAPYLALNMQRYVGNMLACLVPLLAAGWQRLALPMAARLVLGPVLVLLALQGIDSSDLPDFKVPAGSTVLTTFSQATFAIPMANPGTVSTLPAMEVGASTQRVQAQVVALQKSRVDCQELHGLGVTHLVEKTWVGAPAPCMQLQATKGAWRLWGLQ